MPSGSFSALAGPSSRGAEDLKAGGVGRQIALACFWLSFLLSVIAVVGIWGLPIGGTVYLSADGRSAHIRSFQQTVGEVLSSNRIVLGDGDLVTPAEDTRLYPGIRITVLRAVPVTLTVGTAQWGSVRVAAATVGEALWRMGVVVNAGDRVDPDPATSLSSGMQITVERREMRSWIERGTIAFATQVERDETLFKGHQLVRSAGKPGVRERTVREYYTNGRFAALSPTAWSVLQNPVPRVIAVGARAMIASRGAFAGREYMVMEATAYYPGPNNWGGGVGLWTATGALAKRGVVAVDPSVIRLRSHLYIEGYGYAVAEDTGGAIKGLRIDLCYNTYDEAIQFGRRTVKVYILDKQ